VHLEASTEPHVHKKVHKFSINMAFTMAYPNFKKGLKMAFGPLGVIIVANRATLMLIYPLKYKLSLWGTNQFWAASFELTLFLEILNFSKFVSE
jgi:hypothetical protein